jgi:hypothetical protein
METLDQIMIKTNSDKASWAHGYCSAYDTHFSHLRDKSIVLLELGVGGEGTQLGGASLQGWEQYFPNARICGIDIYPKSALDTDRISTFTGSQIDEGFLTNVLAMTSTPDIIIDDASHINEYTIQSFKLLFPKLKPGGIYAIEDLQCSFRWDFGGTHDLKDFYKNTIMNYLFELLQNIQPIQYANPNYVQPELFSLIESVHFYRDMVIIKKKL